MTAVPLRCYICPQEPEFSDLSHLLTHVSSKGHLSHYLKAQLRGRSEPAVRAKFDAYNQWYERHQIERLLTDRLSAKTSKPEPDTDQKPSSAKSTKTGRTAKKRVKKPTLQPQPSTPVKTEITIDPQLAPPQAPPRHVSDFQFGQNGLSTDDTRLHVPHMSELQYWQAQTHLASDAANYPRSYSTHEQPSAGPHLGNEADTFLETDCFKASVRSPTRSAYVESPELNFSIPVSRQPQSREASAMPRVPSIHTLSDNQEKDGVLGDLDPVNSLILKGVKWPGMSLFDSACADAQRLRNQKKDRSILERMAQNSSVIEQMEHIYWPDGTLKKSRFITGNVDSSPSSLASPVLKPTRRPRTVKPRSVLADLDTNELTVPNKIQRKSKTARSSLIPKGRKSVSESNPSHAITTPEVARPAKRRLTINQQPPNESPSVRPSRRNVDVFQDGRVGKPLVGLHHVSRSRNPYESHSQPVAGGYQSDPRLGHNSLASGDWLHQPRSYPKTPDRTEAQKSLPNEPKPQASGEPAKENVGRITQRYFSVTGNEEPQFFASMPPQMEFGGMAGPKYRGATLNPLNPYLRQARH